MTIWHRNGGTFKSTKAAWRMVNGVWTPVKQAYRMVGGEWKACLAFFTPDLASPYAWLDATLSPITKDGSNQISQWSGLVGGRNATQGTTARMPIHDPTNDWINLSTTARFFSAGSSPGLLPTGNTSWTAFVVGRVSALPTNNQTMVNWLRQGSEGNNLNARIKIGNYNGPYNRISLSHYGNDGTYGTTPMLANTDYIMVYRYDGATKRCWLNGNLEASVAYTSQNIATSPSYYSIGPDPSGPSTSNDYGQTGQIRTLVTFHSALDDATRQKMEGYLAHKWGLQNSLVAGHPYISSPPPA